MSTREERAIIAQTRRRLDNGGRARRQETLLLCRRLELLAERFDAAPSTEDYHDLVAYNGNVVEAYNALMRALGDALGIEIALDGAVWRWRWGQVSGTAATVADAYLAGVRAAGAKKPGPPPLDQQLRAQGAPELPGLRAYDPPPHCDECGLPLLNGSIADEVVIAGPNGKFRRVHHVCGEALKNHGWTVIAIAKGV